MLRALYAECVVQFGEFPAATLASAASAESWARD